MSTRTRQRLQWAAIIAFYLGWIFQIISGVRLMPWLFVCLVAAILLRPRPQELKGPPDRERL